MVSSPEREQAESIIALHWGTATGSRCFFFCFLGARLFATADDGQRATYELIGGAHKKRSAGAAAGGRASTNTDSGGRTKLRRVALYSAGVRTLPQTGMLQRPQILGRSMRVKPRRRRRW